MLTYPLSQHFHDSVINRTKVRYVKKPQFGYCDDVWHHSTKQLDGCANMHAALTRCAV